MQAACPCSTTRVCGRSASPKMPFAPDAGSSQRGRLATSWNWKCSGRDHRRVRRHRHRLGFTGGSVAEVGAERATSLVRVRSASWARMPLQPLPNRQVQFEVRNSVRIATRCCRRRSPPRASSRLVPRLVHRSVNSTRRDAGPRSIGRRPRRTHRRSSPVCSRRRASTATTIAAASGDSDRRSVGTGDRVDGVRRDQRDTVGVRAWRPCTRRPRRGQAPSASSTTVHPSTGDVGVGRRPRPRSSHRRATRCAARVGLVDEARHTLDVRVREFVDPGVERSRSGHVRRAPRPSPSMIAVPRFTDHDQPVAGRAHVAGSGRSRPSRCRVDDVVPLTAWRVRCTSPSTVTRMTGRRRSCRPAPTACGRR